MAAAYQNKKPPPPAAHVVDIPSPPPGKAENHDISIGEICCFAIFLLFLFAIFSPLLLDQYSPAFTVTNLSVTSSPLGFEVTVAVKNPNDLTNLKHSAVSVLYHDLLLGSGALAEFQQPRKNATVLRAALPASDAFVRGAAETALRNDERRGRVPLYVSIEAPYKYKLGSLELRKDTISVGYCLVLDSFNENATIISHFC